MDFWSLSPEELLRLVAVSPDELDPETALVRSTAIDALLDLPRDIAVIAWHCGVLDKRQEDVAAELDVDQSTVSRRWKQALSALEGGLS